MLAAHLMLGLILVKMAKAATPRTEEAEQLDAIETEIRRLDDVRMDEVHLTTPVSAEAIRSLKLGEIQSMDGDVNPSERIAVDLEVADAHADAFDALVLPGGQMNPDALRLEPKAIELIKAFAAAGKPVAATEVSGPEGAPIAILIGPADAKVL